MKPRTRAAVALAALPVGTLGAAAGLELAEATNAYAWVPPVITVAVTCEAGHSTAHTTVTNAEAEAIVTSQLGGAWSIGQHVAHGTSPGTNVAITGPTDFRVTLNYPDHGTSNTVHVAPIGGCTPPTTPPPTNPPTTPTTKPVTTTTGGSSTSTVCTANDIGSACAPIDHDTVPAAPAAPATNAVPAFTG